MSKRYKFVALILIVLVTLLSGCTKNLTPVDTETIPLTESQIITTEEQTTTMVETTLKINEEVATTQEYINSIVLSDYLYDHPTSGWVYTSVNAYSADDLSKELFVISDQEEVNIIGQYKDKFIVEYDNKTVLVSMENIIERMNYSTYNDLWLTDLNKISESKTVSTSTSSGRANNLALSANSLNVVIPAGAVFSFNAIVGPRNSKTGYQKASVIQNGGYVQGYGGGVCQTSTTVYMAVLNAISKGYEFETIERHDHQLEVGYASRGEEAAIYWGSYDQRWINKNDFDIAIKMWTEDQTVYAEFYRI